MSHFRSRSGRLAAGAALLGLLAGCTGAGTKSPAGATGTPTSANISHHLRSFYEQKITWTDCGDGFQCGRLKVPLDYAHSSGETIELAVIRTPATEQGNRIGSLLLNPGGPGASGVEAAREAEDIVTERLRARFDIVGFDPRGVGQSAAIRCLSDQEMDAYVRVDGTPDDQAEVTELLDADKKFSAACQKNSGSLLAHVSTAEAVRDMDVLRAALGDAKLHYLGWSYGTYLGAVYAEQFPDKVGRLVLDGAVDPRMGSLEATRAQAAGFELALDSFLADCVKRSDCPLGTDVPKARQHLAALLQRTDRTPLPGSGARTVNEPLVSTGIAVALYAKEGWPILRDALAQANAGQGRYLLALADLYYERDSGGHYKNSLAAQAAINCLDSPPAARTVEEVRVQIPSFEQVSPVFGREFAWYLRGCADWPVPPVGRPHEIKAEGAAPILVVGTTRDPATPYAWAQGLAEQLSSGVLLTYDGDGHTAYSGTGNSCVTGAVDTYLIEGRPPADGTRCT